MSMEESVILRTQIPKLFLWISGFKVIHIVLAHELMS